MRDFKHGGAQAVETTQHKPLFGFLTGSVEIVQDIVELADECWAGDK